MIHSSIQRLLRSSLRVLVGVSLVGIGFGCRKDEGPIVQRDGTADQVYQLCAQCHGQDLQGNPDIAAPAVAGLPEWYVTAQLKKFKEGVRGTHFDDIAGMRMRPMAMSLTEADIRVVAARVSAMAAHSLEPQVQDGDAGRGKTLYAPCTACHGANGAGNQQLSAPPLTDAPDWYLLTQLKNFKHGVRGANPKDTTGAQMRPMAQGLADEQAMRDVIAYIGTL